MHALSEKQISFRKLRRTHGTGDEALPQFGHIPLSLPSAYSEQNMYLKEPTSPQSWPAAGPGHNTRNSASASA
jgi:hypothetical protein